MAPCEICHTSRAQILRPKTRSRVCGTCFISSFETEIAETITSTKLFQPGEKIAIGASGGKDSTVLASVLKTLNERHDWNLDLVLLSIDEGIQGYRDHSLEAVKRNSEDLGLPLKIVSYAELYGWSMDQVVAQIGKKSNCTYCGVFRRQALDRGAAMLGVGHVVTGHNADDVAETVLMNLLRGDLPRLSRATSIVTSTPAAAQPVKPSTNDDAAITFTNVKRSKPLMYAYEKEIVLYAHHKKLDYFSTECIYSPEAFRGSARTLIKSLERIRPESIADIVRSGVDMAKLVPDINNGGDQRTRGTSTTLQDVSADAEDSVGGCGKHNNSSGLDDMDEMERRLADDDPATTNGTEREVTNSGRHVNGHRHDRHGPSKPHSALSSSNLTTSGRPPSEREITSENVVTILPKQEKKPARRPGKDAQLPKQTLGRCERCGYLSSQAVCKACVLLEGLNKARPKTDIAVGEEG